MVRALVEVDAGICGFVTRIVARPVGDGTMVDLAIDSDCPNVQSLAADLRQLDPMLVFRGKAKDGAVFAAAAGHPLHQACPVPIGVLKAVEVAAGFALPRDAAIKVGREDE